MHLEVIITFIISSLALTISPGPDIVYVISQSFIRGKKAAIITSVGLTTGLLFHTLFVIIGLSLLLRENENIFFLLKLLGSMYFIYLKQAHHFRYFYLILACKLLVSFFPLLNLYLQR